MRQIAKHECNRTSTKGIAMKIFGLGVPELLIILAVALLIFGPKHLPKLGRSLGRTIHNFREGLGSDKDVVKEVEVEEQPKRKKKAAAKKLEAAKDDAPEKGDAEAQKATEAEPAVETEVAAEKAEA